MNLSRMGLTTERTAALVVLCQRVYLVPIALMSWTADSILLCDEIYSYLCTKSMVFETDNS